MIFLEFPNKDNHASSWLYFNDIKTAFKYFYHKSRFCIRNGINDFYYCYVYNNNEKIFEWTYCKVLCPEDIDYLELDDPYCYICKPYYFFSRRLNK